ncbi:MAG: protein kinase domain-containing protein [Planctomycetota bacterium]
MPPLERLGPYIIESALGRGGMGRVYVGVDEQSGDRVAVKVLSPALGNDPSFRERFATEIETLKKLRHPNIVQLLGFGEQDGQLFYAMEMVEGYTLQQELHAGRRFQWREVARIGVQISQALKHAHDRGIIHRDLKPANLLYPSDEQVKLADFGIAKLYGTSQLTMAGGVVGTADYMSPEQAEGKGVTTRSDLYGLGCVMFALLVGHPPFASSTAPEVLHKLRYEKTPSIRRNVPEIPSELELIITQLLEKDPARRIATALAVANRLKAMEHGLSLETKPCSDSDEFDLKNHRNSRDEADNDSSATSGTLETGPTAGPNPVPNAAEDSFQKHRKPTVALPGTDEASSPEVESSDGAHSTHFTTFDEEARQRAASWTLPEDTEPPWRKVVPLLAAVVLLIAAIIYFSLPATADSLYREIMSVAEDGDPSDLVKVESEIDEYLERYPETEKYGEVRELRRELDLYRLEKQYERRARLRRNAEDMGPVERAYIDAIRLATTDPMAAAGQLRAIVDVYGGAEISDEDRRCLELAREQRQDLENRSRELFDDQVELLHERLDAAAAMADEQPDRAQAVREGIVALYRGKSWAQPAVKRARAALEQDTPR